MINNTYIRIVAAACLFIAAMVLINRCTSGDGGKQAAQSAATAEALGNAAQATIQRVGDRVATEEEIDRTTARTMEEIGNAQDPDAIRAAVLDRLCAKASHRTDPACTMR